MPEHSRKKNTGRAFKPVPGDASENSAIITRNLSKTYGEGDAQVRAIDGIDLEFRKGELTAIIGASGSGKSTLLHCIAGLDTPTAGDSWVSGLHVQSMGKKERARFRREDIGVVFQQKGLVPVLTARENILLPFSLEGKEPDWDEFDRVIAQIGMTSRLEHMPDQLSGGQKQKAAVARVILQKPKVVLADEPTGSLDVESSAAVMDLLRHDLVDTMGITVVLVTHSVEAAQMADRTIALSDGHVTADMQHPTRTELENALATIVK